MFWIFNHSFVIVREVPTRFTMVIMGEVESCRFSSAAEHDCLVALMASTGHLVVASMFPSASEGTVAGLVKLKEMENSVSDMPLRGSKSNTNLGGPELSEIHLT